MTDRNRRLPNADPTDSADVGGLLRQLATDGRALLNHEIDLAKLEVRQAFSGLAKSSVYMLLGLVLLALGLIVLLVFAVIGLGRLLGDEYWLSSLIVGGTLAFFGAILLFAGRRNLGRGQLKPEAALRSARETAAWAGAEAREIKRDLTR